MGTISTPTLEPIKTVMNIGKSLTNSDFNNRNNTDLKARAYCASSTLTTSFFEMESCNMWASPGASRSKHTLDRWSASATTWDLKVQRVPSNHSLVTWRYTLAASNSIHRRSKDLLSPTHSSSLYASRDFGSSRILHVGRVYKSCKRLGKWEVARAELDLSGTYLGGELQHLWSVFEYINNSVFEYINNFV